MAKPSAGGPPSSGRSGKTGSRTGLQAPLEKKNGKSLLSRPSPELLAALERVIAATDRVFPMSVAHRKDLPFAVRDLSQMLTTERAELSRSYWSAPRYLAAYLHYFLPWNLYRLAWLLPGLPLNFTPDARILDLGSGPLTLPLALWCARPELRSVPLHFTCSDVSLAPLEKGRDILKELAGQASPWRISLLRAPVEKALHAPSASPWHGIMAGNVLNELCTRRQSGEEPLAARLEKLMARASSCLAPQGRLFLVEPGARIGGKLIALARQGALLQRLRPLAPCTHSSDCPMAGSPGEAWEDASSRRPLYSGWCHFIHPALDAPGSLQELSRKARLEKNSLAVSCLLLEKANEDEEKEGEAGARAKGKQALDELRELEALFQEIMREDEGMNAGRGGRRTTAAGNARDTTAEGLVRVISAPIALPAGKTGETTTARYACCEKGLALVLNASRLPSGAALTLPWPVREERDGKTGALLLRRDEERTAKNPAREDGSARNASKDNRSPSPGAKPEPRPKARRNKSAQRSKKKT